MPVVFVLDVARGKDAVDVGTGRVSGCQKVAGVVHRELTFERCGVGVMTNGEEESFDVEVTLRPVGRRLQTNTRDLVGSMHIHHGGVVQDLDLVVVEDTLLHDLARTERVASVNEVDLAREPREEGCLFHGRVSATDDGDRYILEEEAVAGGARADAMSPQTQLVRQTEIAGACTCCDDQRICLNLRTKTRLELVRAARQVGRHNLIELKRRTKALALRFHIVHEFWTHDALWKPREVVDLGGRGQLSTGLEPLVDDWCEICA